MSVNYEIFISYSRKDLAKVKEIKAIIEQSTGARCWLDLKEIEAGATDITREITNGIKNSKVFLFMYSINSKDSEYALKEMRFAEKYCEHSVIIRIDNEPFNDVFDFHYNLADAIDWNNSAQRNKLLSGIISWVIKNSNYVENLSLYTEKDILKIIDSFGEDKNEALKFITKLAEKNNPTAQFFLGLAYLSDDEIPGVRHNYTECYKWFLKSANQGHATAQALLAYLYESGMGVNENFSEALKWYRKAANQGNEEAIDRLKELGVDY